MNEYPFIAFSFFLPSFRYLFLHITIASLPAQLIDSLHKRDEQALKDILNRNFDLRREIWGDQALGGEDGFNLRMIQVCIYAYAIDLSFFLIPFALSIIITDCV